MPFKVMDLFDLLDEVEKSRGQSLSEKKESFFRAMEDTFSCPGGSSLLLYSARLFLWSGFLLRPFGTVEGGTRGLNLELIKKTYERIFRSYDERLLTVIAHSCTSSLAICYSSYLEKRKKGSNWKTVYTIGCRL